MAKCPFLDPNFDLEVDDPCPVCGMLGGWGAEDKCVGNIVDTGDEMHQILGSAIASIPDSRGSGGQRS